MRGRKLLFSELPSAQVQQHPVLPPANAQGMGGCVLPARTKKPSHLLLGVMVGVLAVSCVSVVALSAAETPQAQLPANGAVTAARDTNGAVMKTAELQQQLTVLNAKKIDESLRMYEGLEDIDKALVCTYLNIGLRSPNNERLRHGVVNLIMGLNNKKVFTAFVQNPTRENMPEETTEYKFGNASRAFGGAETIITEEMIAEIRSLDGIVVEARNKIYAQRIADADARIADSLKKQEEIKEVKTLTDEIIEMSKKFKKATGE